MNEIETASETSCAHSYLTLAVWELQVIYSNNLANLVLTTCYWT